MLSIYPKLGAVLCVAASLSLFSCSSTQRAKASARQERDLKPAADFTLKDANGNSIKLSDYRGKVVLLNFWATWCGPCQLEIPWFIEFQQQYKSKGLQVLGVSMDDDGWAAVKPYIAQHKINYPIVLGNDSVSQLYGGIDSLPTTFIIDQEGRIAYPPHVGLVGKNEYLSEIQGLLGSKQQETGNRHHLSAAAPALLFRSTK